MDENQGWHIHSSQDKQQGMIRNILFDWSGTLVDDLPAVWKATNYVFRQAGIEELTLDRFRAEFCLPFQKFYDRFTPQVPMAQLEDWFHRCFRGAQDSVGEIPRAREFLECCRQRGIRLFVLSTVHPEHYAAQADATGFGKYFERVYAGVPDKQAKIQALLEENKLAPDQSLFIGDMQHDIETAKHGGVFSCAVLTGYTGLEQLRASQPDLIVEHLGELQHLLEQSGWDFTRLGRDSRGLRTDRPVATVGAAVFDAQHRVLMIRTHKWSNLWGIPGGKIRYGEPAMDALRRELKEETNLDVGNIEFVVVQDCIHSTEFYREAHFILLNYTCQCIGEPQVKLNEEAQEFCWVSLAEAEQMQLNQPTRRLLAAIPKR
jgi:phosphoglycolate phosphatase